MSDHPERHQRHLLGFSWPQLAQIAAVVGVIASGAFVSGTYIQRLETAETVIAGTEKHLERVDERLGLLASEMRALREFVEAAVRYARLTPQKESRNERSLVE